MGSRKDRFGDKDKLSIVDLDEMRALGNTQCIGGIMADTSMGQILNLLKEERRGNALYDEIWRRAERVYEQRKGQLSGTRECCIALISYTMDKLDPNDRNSPALYREFNKESRCLTYEKWNLFPYKSLWLLLSKALNDISGGPSVFRPGFVCYRGVEGHFKPVFPKQGKLIIFSSFSSASIKKEVALDFIPRKGGTLIEFHFQPMAGKGIKAYSVSQDEEEVLLYPWCCYEVIAHEQPKGTIYTKLVLQTAGPFAYDLPYTVPLPGMSVEKSQELLSRLSSRPKSW